MKMRKEFFCGGEGSTGVWKALQKIVFGHGSI